MKRLSSSEYRVTQRKGDIAVAQSIATFTKLGADVLLPLTESAAYDIVVDLKGKLYRVQVRYCSAKEVGLRRIHSNSKGYVIKMVRTGSFDWLYILYKDGSEFLIVEDLTNRSSITPKTEHLLETVFRSLFQT